MEELNLREKAIFTGLFLSKFDKDGLKILGFNGFNEAFNAIGLSLNIKPASIKNYRDEFDTVFPNSRKGWHKRGIRDYCKVFFEKYGHLEIEIFSNSIKQLIFGKNDIENIIEISTEKDKKEETFAKRLITGVAAEKYFYNVYTQISFFQNLMIEDTTKFGCGFDFKLFSEEIFYGVEVKGLSTKTGGISLTEKEYKVANFMKDCYFLFVVKNFNEKPFHEIYRNPINNTLNFKKIEKTIIQVNWNTNL